jgi:two-component system sensor histidine kinase RstB
MSLAGFLAGLVLLSFLVIATSNHVRHQAYWSHLVDPVLRYVSEHQFILADLNMNALSVVSSDQDNIDNLIHARLDLGQVVFTSTEGLFLSYVSLEPTLLLELESDQSGRSIYELYLKVFSGLLEATDNQESVVAELANAWGMALYPLEQANALRSQSALDSLSEKGFYLVVSDKSVSALLRAPTGEIYRVVFPEPFSLISWPVLGLLIFGLLASIYGLVAVFVQGYERKLLSVETVAARISRGELDARVKISNDGNESVERLGTAFNAMADHIQRLMLVQKEMIHAVSHELRTPVARIRFGVQMIEDCFDDASRQKQIKGIDGDIQELDELIDEILTYARLEQGGPILSFQHANLFDIVYQVVDEQSVGKPDLEISSVMDAESDEWHETEVEPRYIHRSIQNLVGNATRYAKSKVRVTCHCDQDTCRVDVEDDGPGIPEDQWESVFTAFARLDDSRTRSSGGYGLGLSIVRRILHWHGGKAFLGRSDALGGAKFSLVWPRNQRSSEMADGEESRIGRG